METTMNIEQKFGGLCLGNEYGSYLIIKNDTFNHVEYDNGKSYLEKDESVEICMGEFDEEDAPQVSKTLTFEQLKALADFCNKRIADIEAAKLSERLYHE